MNRNENILNLLSRRERYSVRSHDSILFSSIHSNRSVHVNDLSIVSAWNPKRLNNMILAVGPKTPYSLLKKSTQRNSSSSDSENVREDDRSSDDDDDDDSVTVDVLGQENMSMDSVEIQETRKRPSNRKLSTEDEASEVHQEDQEELNEFLGMEDDSQVDEEMSDSSSSSASIHETSCSYYKTAMSHSGCINTACWLDSQWQISTARTDEDSFLNTFVQSSSYSSNSAADEASSVKAVSSYDCPTQIMTSGDDKRLKFWDCSTSMAASPSCIEKTSCPFAFSSQSGKGIKGKHAHVGHTENILGSVQFLASLKTGHMGNVFHCIPRKRPGDVITCAADGMLNLCNIEHDTCTTILSSEGMFFSHVMLDDNIGLVCGEKGLRRFDLRISRENQANYCVLEEGICKSCAIYSAEESSAYVFAGGASEVALYDLRFLSRSRSVVQNYRPSCFPDEVDVSISGIDLSRDKKELLVSYENDQIYTFPAFPNHVNSSNVSIEDLMTMSSKTAESPLKTSPHFASYGGHLNRFTFLKCAKYAGPNDEYICTGSDSGHAFIYDKHSSGVVSLLKTDRSTCNGIIPHKTLPFFICYGIDSTAKLWRASLPARDEDDDSPSGRRRAYHEKDHVKNPLVHRWLDVRANLLKITTDPDLQEIDPTLFPDELSLRSFNLNGHVFDGLPELFFRSIFHSSPFNPGSKEICNDLHCLPEVLRSNYYEAVSAVLDSDEVPVKCGLDELHRRISSIRLCYQADQLGISIDPDKPWSIVDSNEVEDDSISYTDLIPDSPSDWLPYDNRFTTDPLDSGRRLNVADYEDFFLSRYCSEYSITKSSNKSQKDDEQNDDGDISIHSKSWDKLHSCVKALKEEGNAAILEGAIQRGMGLYSKALVYCAAGFMIYPESNLDFLRPIQRLIAKNSGHVVRWSELLKTFISIRLNLSMTLLKKEVFDPEAALSQASLALQDLRPFTSEPGIVLTGRKLQKPRDNEPLKTYHEAKEFQSKAYFRKGTAEFHLGHYVSASHMLEKCLEVSKELHPSREPDKHVVRKLEECKRLISKQKKRRRKKFKMALGLEEENEESPNNQKESSSK